MQKVTAIICFLILSYGNATAQQTINMREFTFTIPDTPFHTSICNHHDNFLKCNSFTKCYYEIKKDTFFYYETQQTYSSPQNYNLVSIEAVALKDIDMTETSIEKRKDFIDRDSCLYSIDIVDKSKLLHRGKVKCIIYYREGKIKKSRQWHMLFDCKDKNLLEEIKSKL